MFRPMEVDHRGNSTRQGQLIKILCFISSYLHPANECELIAWLPQIFLRGKYFDFKRATVFCLGHRLSKHKTTRYARHFGGITVLHPLATHMMWIVLGETAKSAKW